MPRSLATTTILVATLLAISAPALGGESDSEPDDSHVHGAPFFGEAKNIPTMAPLSDVRVRAQVRGTTRFFLTTTDDDGRFRRSGMGPDVDPDAVDVTCEKEGFRVVEVLRKRLSGDKHAPVEIECLLEKAR